MAQHCLRLALATLLWPLAVFATDYTGWKLVQINEISAEGIEWLEGLGADVWSADANGAVVQVSPDILDTISCGSFKNYTILEENIQSAIDSEKQRIELSTTMAKAQSTDPLSWFTEYRRFEEIRQWFENMEREHGSVMRIVKSIGYTFERRDIFAVHFNADDQSRKRAFGPKPKIWVQCLIHAREWISGPVCQYITHSIVNGLKKGDPQIKSLLSRVEIVMIPVANPDGYSYTWSTDRLWRKNRNGPGTDLNRNFPEKWGTVGRPGPAHELYGGQSAASEPETQAIMRYFDFVWSKGDIIGALDFHSYGQLVLRPLGWTKQVTKHDEFLRFASNRISQAMRINAGKIYAPQRSSDLYLNAGTATDWFYASGTWYSLAIELPPASAGSNAMQGFMLPANEILPVCRDAWAGFLAFADFALGNPLS